MPAEGLQKKRPLKGFRKKCSLDVIQNVHWRMSTGGFQKKCPLKVNKKMSIGGSQKKCPLKVFRKSVR